MPSLPKQGAQGSSKEDSALERVCAVVRWVAVAAVIAIAAGLAARWEWRSLSVTDFFWQGIVPLVPLTLLLMPHLWRSICPVAALDLLGARLARGGHPIGLNLLPRGIYRWLRQHGVTFGAALLWVLVPLRLLLFNQSARATLVLLGAIVVAAAVMGLAAPWKAGWCSSVCPVYPVEKLYGLAPVRSLRDPRCFPQDSHDSCHRCALHCLDVPLGEQKYWDAMGRVPISPFTAAVQNFFFGSFPGFVLAYFLLNNLVNLERASAARAVPVVYGTFFALMVACYALYRISRVAVGNQLPAKASTWTRRVDLLAVFVAINLYYLIGGVGIAKVVSKLGGWESAPAGLANAIVVFVLMVSLIWLRRGWHSQRLPWGQW